MGHEDGGDWRLLPDLDQLHLHVVAQARVEIRQGLVQQQHARLVDQRAREGDALLLPARELARIAVADRRQAHEIERARDTSVALGRVIAAPHLHRKGEIVLHRHMRKQRVGLEHQPDVAFLRRRAAHIGIADQHAAARRHVEAGDQPQQRCLAAAGRTHQRDEAAVRDGQIDAFQRLDLAEALRQSFDRDASHIYPTTCLPASRRSLISTTKAAIRMRMVDAAATPGSGLNSRLA